MEIPVTEGERAQRVLSSWSALYEARKELLRRYRTVWDIPIERRHTRILLGELSPNARVLEIGSSDRALERLLLENYDGLSYKSMDVDRETRQDYYDLDAIGECFDAVLLFEVIEHLPWSEGVRLLGRIRSLLAPGGKLLITTPNVAHPTHYYRDPTHLAPYSHEGIGGALLALGFEVARMSRIWDAPLASKLLHRYILSPVHRFLGIDFAHTLMVVAARPKEV